MTAVDIEELEALLAGARDPWAWEAVSNDDNSWCIGVTEPLHAGQIIEADGVEKPEVVAFVAESGCDGFQIPALICALHNAAPALLAELRELRAIRSLLREYAYALRACRPGTIDALAVEIGEVAEKIAAESEGT